MTTSDPLGGTTTPGSTSAPAVDQFGNLLAPPPPPRTIRGLYLDIMGAELMDGLVAVVARLSGEAAVYDNAVEAMPPDVVDWVTGSPVAAAQRRAQEKRERIVFLTYVTAHLDPYARYELGQHEVKELGLIL